MILDSVPSVIVYVSVLAILPIRKWLEFNTSSSSELIDMWVNGLEFIIFAHLFNAFFNKCSAGYWILCS